MEQQIGMPSGMGGLTRYFEEYKSRFQMKPWHIIALVVALILFEVVLRFL